jgi:serine/threonine-protein kinase
MMSPPDPSRTFTPEVTAEAAWRLGWLGLIYATASIVEHFVRHSFMAGAIGDTGPHAADLFRLGGIAMGLAMFGLSRSRLISAQQLLDLGLFFEVAGAFAIAATEFWHGVPASAYESFAQVPAECLWIVAFPLVVPASPRKVLVASFAAATMGPAALSLAIVFHHVVVERPIQLTGFFATSDYLSAAAAYAIARIMHGVHVRLKRAREIGSYELVERIGEGGMGEVWRAKHRLLARPAAVKLIRRDALGADHRTRDAMIHRFEREAQETAALRHSYGERPTGVTEQATSYVMELFDGLSLEQLVDRHDRRASALRGCCSRLATTREAHAWPDPSRYQTRKHLRLPSRSGR